MNKEELCERLEQVEAPIPTGFEHCLIGVGVSFDGVHALLNEQKVIAHYMKRDGMTEEEAREFYEYNTLGAGMANATVFTELLDEEGPTKAALADLLRKSAVALEAMIEAYGDSMPHMEYITRSNHVADALGLLAIMEDSDVEPDGPTT